MSRDIFGWSYPPGCSGPPYDNEEPIALELGDGIEAYWFEDNHIEITLSIKATCEWSDSHTEEVNIASATREALRAIRESYKKMF